MPDQLSLDEALNLMRRRPGLVFGRTAITHMNVHDDIMNRLREELKTATIPEDVTTVAILFDYLKANLPDKIADARQVIVTALSTVAGAASANHLARGRWSACVSLTEDMILEDELQEKADRTANSTTVTVIDHPSVIPKSRTLPVYKLLGNFRDSREGHRLALARSEYLARRRAWQKILVTLPDYLKDAPLFFVGTEMDLQIVQDFLSELYGLKPPYPNLLLFLKGDGTEADSTIRSLVSEYSNIAVVDCSLNEICQALEEFAPSRRYATEELQVTHQLLTASWHKFADAHKGIIELVPSHPPPEFDIESNRSRLIDALFRPTSVDWLPFLVDYDLPRDGGKNLEAAIINKQGFLEKHPRAIIAFRGEAGVGKSTAIKRVAVNLARKGSCVLWCRRPPADVSGGAFRKFTKALREYRQKTKAARQSPIVVMCDDPWGLRISPEELVHAFEDADIPTVLVFAFRSSEYAVQEGITFGLSSSVDEEVWLDHVISEEELAAFKELLVRVNIAATPEQAATVVADIPNRDSQDILCSLWYLVPQTRAAFSASLQDEYFRLGGVTGAIQAYASAAANMANHARLAYEATTVTSSLEIGLPLEVLVRSLGMGYDVWRAMCVDGKPLWGLIYDDMDEDDNLVFHTRNYRVTTVLLQLVNGGVGRAGEIRVLRRLVEACTVGTPAYRAFLTDLLVRSRPKLEKRYSFEDGRDLYELAFQVFPEKDRTLEHHYGIWLRNMGPDAALAYRQFEKALETPAYPYSTKGEHLELIHTSMAATVVDLVKAGKQDRETGLALVKDHLRQASPPSRFDPHTSHVFANFLFQFSRFSDAGHDIVTIESIAEALSTLERALQIIGSVGRKRVEFANSIGALTKLQGQILEALSDVEAAKQFAQESFDTNQHQIGFEVVARKLLARAIESGKGGPFSDARDYISWCVDYVEGKQIAASADLLAVRVDLMIRWRLQQTRGPVEWELLCDDLRNITSSSRYRDDFIKLYYYAVSLYHLRSYTEAGSVFSQIARLQPNARVRYGVRDYLLGSEGFPRRLQGTMRRVHNRSYVFCAELGIDLEIEGPPEAGDGATVHVYVGFTLNGPRAVFQKPGGNDTLLP